MILREILIELIVAYSAKHTSVTVIPECGFCFFKILYRLHGARST
jgi:hypothetical protein